MNFSIYKRFVKKLWQHLPKFFLIAIGAFLLSKYNSLDGVCGLVASLFYDEDTFYAQGYSDKYYKHVKIGMTEEDVEKIMLGKPVEMCVEYNSSNLTAPTEIWFKDGYVIDTLSHSNLSHIIGKNRNEVIHVLGKPDRERWLYAKPRWSSASYRRREIVFEAGKVVKKNHEFFGS